MTLPLTDKGSWLPDRCPMCAGLGWVLDANGAGLSAPLSLELIPCFYPACPVGSNPPALASVVFKGVHFSSFARHPSEGYIMSVSE